MSEPLFSSLDTIRMAEIIDRARGSVCYAAPGVHQATASALARVAARIGAELVYVCVDFDERVLRMGYGNLDAVATLRGAGIVVRSAAGLRTGLLVVDGEGFIFTPVALYLEAEPTTGSAPNALRLTAEQTAEAMARLSPAAKAIAVASAKSEPERERIKAQAVEVVSVEVSETQFRAVERRIKEIPPVDFDVVRQVRVFEPYMQYVELSLTGAAVQRHRVEIPRDIQRLGGDKELEGRLRTTFDLIEKSAQVSSKSLDAALNEIRTNLTRSLGKDHGRVVLKAAKPQLLKRLKEFEAKLQQHQDAVRKELQGSIDESRKKVVNYYLPRVMESPPDALIGESLSSKPTEQAARDWLERKLDEVFPRAEDLIKEMKLEVRFKDVTFETLNRDDFLESVKKAFPYARIDWDKAYAEFKAAREKHRPPQPREREKG